MFISGKKAAFLMVYVISCLTQVSCGGSSFVGGQAPSVKRIDSKSESGGKTNEREEKQADANPSNPDKQLELEESVCPGFTRDEHTQVIEVTQSGEPLALKPDSIVILKAAGNAKVSLNAKDTSSIKGLCIIASGGSSLEIDTSLVIAKMYYYGRGNASSRIDFGETGVLERLDTDLAGKHSLKIAGDNLACDNLIADVKGESQIECGAK